MNARESLFYGLGLMAYTVAKADGAIQIEEREELRKLISDWCKNVDIDFDITEIIFSVLQKSKPSMEDGYQLGMKNIRLGASYFTPELKTQFFQLLVEVAKAFPPVTIEEQSVLDRYASDIEQL